MELKIGWLYPTLMSTYGDRGNVICIQRRAQWRGIEVEVVSLDQQSSAMDFRHVDIVAGCPGSSTGNRYARSPRRKSGGS
jgi:lipid II isoglutaminyl synthase (glutamine-hydrolysing)